MMPNTSVRPAAIRNSIRPNCRPLRNCSKTRVLVIVEPPAPFARGARHHVRAASRPRGGATRAGHFIGHWPAYVSWCAVNTLFSVRFVMRPWASLPIVRR